MAVRTAYALVSNGKLWRNECKPNKGQYLIFGSEIQALDGTPENVTAEVKKVKIEIVEG